MVQHDTWDAPGRTNEQSRCKYDFDGDIAYTGLIEGGSFPDLYGSPAVRTGVGLKPGDLSSAAQGFQILSESCFVTEDEHLLRVVTDLENAPWLSAYPALMSFYTGKLNYIQIGS